MYASARDVRVGIAEMLRPPLRLRVSEAAQQSLNIVNPSGTAGTWSPDVSPYMVEPMDLAQSRLYEAIVFAGPARSGKTIALIDGVVAYSVFADPADTMIVQTNQSQAEDYSKTRIGRAIEGSPELKKRLSSRAHDDNVLLKFFRSGMALRFGWPSLAQLSGKDIRRILMTDVDNFTGDLSIDEAFGLALKRIQTYMSAGILLAESSPAKDYVDGSWRPHTPHEAPPCDGILALYNRGDRRRWYWRCPECKVPFQAEPGLGLFKLPSIEELVERVVHEELMKLSERYATMWCPHCGVGVDHRWKREMNRGARWVGEGQTFHPDGTISGSLIRSRTASFWLGGVAAAYQSWASLIERYLQAVKQYAMTGEQRALKTTTNVDQAMPFIPISAQTARDPHVLEQRAEEWTQGEVPEGVRFLIGKIDIQAGKFPRFVVQIMGVGVGLEKWIVDRYALKSSRRPDGKGGFLPIDPASYLEDWDRLIEKVIERRYPLCDGSGRQMPVRYVVCDSGGKAGVTPRAYEFWRSLRDRGLGHKFRLVKGASSANAPRVHESYPDSRGRKERKNSGSAGDVPVLMINTMLIKDAIAADIGRNVVGPGYYHFGKFLPTSFYEELTAETRGPDGWTRPSGKPNETLDLCTYGTAALIHLKADKINWNSPPTWAAPWDKNPDVCVEVKKTTPSRRARRVARSSYLER